MFSFNPKVSTLLRLQLLNSPPKPTSSANLWGLLFSFYFFKLFLKQAVFAPLPQSAFFWLSALFKKWGSNSGWGSLLLCSQTAEATVWNKCLEQLFWSSLPVTLSPSERWHQIKGRVEFGPMLLNHLYSKHSPPESKTQKQSTTVKAVLSQAVVTINHMRDTRLIKQLLSCGCIIGCWHIIWPCRLKRVQFNVLIFSKSFCLMTFYQCYYDFINISISAVNDCISLRSSV